VPDPKSELESLPGEDSRGDATQERRARKVRRRRDAAGEPRLVVVFVRGQPLVEGECISLAKASEVWLMGARTRAVVSTGRKMAVKFDDKAMSRQHAVLRRVAGGWRLEDRESKNGTLVNGTPRTKKTLSDGDVIEVGDSVLLFLDQGTGAVGMFQPEARGGAVHRCSPRTQLAFRTLSGELERALFDLYRFAPTGVSVLIRGDNGTGKELVARALHELSGRPGPFTAVNCGALPSELVESELFGSQRGAYTGSREDRVGIVRGAERGTLFLDEVGDLPKESQAALLRVLQEREVLPIGAGRPVAIDIRVVAATNQDLEAMIRDGRFRRDLYSRLTGFEFDLPPLRERREDIGMLLGTFLRASGGDAPCATFDGEAARALLAYTYPGNIRELGQAVVASLVVTEVGHIELEHLPKPVRSALPENHLTAEEQELCELVLDSLREHRGNVSAVARAMKKDPTQIKRWLRRFKIDPDDFRDPDP